MEGDWDRAMEMIWREAAVPANAAAYFSVESPLHEVKSTVETVMARMMIVVNLMLMKRDPLAFLFKRCLPKSMLEYYHVCNESVER